MKHTLLLLIILFATGIKCKAQFPSFISQDYRKYYVDSSKETRMYRDLAGKQFRIEPWNAFAIVNYYGHRIKEVNKTIGKLRDSVGRYEIRKMRNSMDSEKVYVNHYDRRTIERIDSTICSLQDSIGLYREVAGYFHAVNKFTGNPRFRNAFLPLVGYRYGYHKAKFFYQGDVDTTHEVNILSNIVYQTSLDRNVVSSDLVSGIMRGVLVKWFISSSLSVSDDTTASAKAATKTLYDGAFNFGAEYPIIFSHTPLVTFYMPVSAKICMDQSKLPGSAPIEDILYFGNISLSAYMSWASNEGKDVTFFANGKLSYIDGGSLFYDNLNLASRTGFGLIQASVGIEIKGKYRFAVNAPLYCSNEDILANQKITVGVQFAPGLLKSK